MKIKNYKRFNNAVWQWMEAVEQAESNYNPEQGENKKRVDTLRLKAVIKADRIVDNLIEHDNYVGWKQLADEKDDDAAWFEVGKLLDEYARRTKIIFDKFGYEKEY